MEIIEIKKKYLGLDEDEIVKLKSCVKVYAYEYKNPCPKIAKFAKYMIAKLEELEP